MVNEKNLKYDQTNLQKFKKGGGRMLKLQNNRHITCIHFNARIFDNVLSVNARQ